MLFLWGCFFSIYLNLSWDWFLLAIGEGGRWGGYPFEPGSTFIQICCWFISFPIYWIPHSVCSWQTYFLCLLRYIYFLARYKWIIELFMICNLFKKNNQATVYFNEILLFFQLTFLRSLLNSWFEEMCTSNASPAFDK